MSVKHHFFAYLGRMKLIDRWALMRCTQRENVQEHSLQVAMFAHALALIKNKHFGGKLSPEGIAVKAIFHDSTEVLTGDLPTPVKYFNNDIRAAYSTIEDHAVAQLLKLLPQEFQSEYSEIFGGGTAEEVQILKAADVLAAYVKCVEEEAAGNHEFSRARKSIELKVKEHRHLPEVEYFVQHFVPSFALTIDEISQPLTL